MADSEKKFVDLECQFLVRSSTESLKVLEEITTIVVDTLEARGLFIVEKNIALKQILGKQLITVRTIVQTAE